MRHCQPECGLAQALACGRRAPLYVGAIFPRVRGPIGQSGIEGSSLEERSETIKIDRIELFHVAIPQAKNISRSRDGVSQ